MKMGFAPRKAKAFTVDTKVWDGRMTSSPGWISNSNADISRACVQDVVIRDRVMLAQDGMFVVIALVDQNTGKLKKSPDLISRGFVYLKENQELLRQVRILIKKSVEDATVKMPSGAPIDLDYIKNNLGETISKYLYQKTAKRPLVIPVVLSV